MATLQIAMKFGLCAWFREGGTSFLCGEVRWQRKRGNDKVGNSFSTSLRHEPLHGTLLGSVRRLSELVVLLVLVVVAVTAPNVWNLRLRRKFRDVHHGGLVNPSGSIGSRIPRIPWVPWEALHFGPLGTNEHSTKKDSNKYIIRFQVLSQLSVVGK